MFKIIILFILFFICIYFFIKTSIASVENNNTNNRRKKLEGNIAEVSVLQFDNVPQGVSANITFNNNKLKITTNGYEKEILSQDIIDITLEYANQIVENKFSFGKAIAGTAILGAIGAIGGFHGNKYIPKVMVISYKENNEIKYLVFLQNMPNKAPITQLKAEAYLLDRFIKQVKGKLIA